MPIHIQKDFDIGLWLLGGREVIPPSAVRVATGINPVHSKTARSRWGNQLAYNKPAVSAFKFYSFRYTVDASGNLYRDGSTIKTGLSGNRVTFTKAPPHFGATSYAFITGAGGTPLKVDPSGNVTNWGLPAAANGATAVASSPIVDVSIDTFQSTSGYTALGGATLSLDSSDYVFGSGSIQVVCPKLSSAGLEQTAAVNLAPSGATQFDNIVLYVQIDHPQYIGDLTIDFDLGTGFTTDYYTASIEIAETVAQNLPGALPAISGLNSAMSSVLGGPWTVPYTLDTQLGGYGMSTFQTYLNTGFGNTSAPSLDPGTGALQQLAGATLQSSTNQWWVVSIPQATFNRIGSNAALGWANVSAYRIRINNLQSTANAIVHFGNLYLSGGVGMVGTYQYMYTWANSVTGSYGNPNPMPITVQNINRTGITLTLSGIPPVSDPQVDTLILWRTMGTGGTFFNCASIPLPLPSTYNDITADFTGYGPASAPLLSIEPLVQPQNIPPNAATYAIYFQGTMFLCGDSTSGARGRIYYGCPGYAEGVSGYTDITNDDDPTVAFFVYSNNLYCLTEKALWQITNISTSAILPGFAAVQVLGAPGTTAPFSVVATPNFAIYEGPDGLYSFDGYFAERICGQILNLFRGEAAEGYPSIGTIVAATFGRDEYWFSDGINNTFALNVMPGSVVGAQVPPIRCHGAPATALFYEPDDGYMLAGWDAGTYFLEYAGITFDTTGTLPFAFRPASLYSGDKYTWKFQRILLDVNVGGNVLTVYASVDGTDYLLGTCVGNTRTKYEFTVNMPGSVIGAYITSPGGYGMIEVFRVALETDVSGGEDNDNAPMR